jgi:hypothetical protein
VQFVGNNIQPDGWDGADSWYLYPGTPDTCGTRAATQHLISLQCSPFGWYSAVRIEWYDNVGVRHLAPVAGITEPCDSLGSNNQTQYVESAGFPSYQFFLRVELTQGGNFQPDCVHDGCDITLRK